MLYRHLYIRFTSPPKKSISFTSQMMSPVLSFRTSSPWELSWPDTCNTPSRTAGTTGKVPGHMQLKAINCSLSSYLSCSCEAFLHELLLEEVLGGAPLFFITTQVLMVKVSHRARDANGVLCVHFKYGSLQYTMHEYLTYLYSCAMPIFLFNSINMCAKHK